MIGTGTPAEQRSVSGYAASVLTHAGKICPAATANQCFDPTDLCSSKGVATARHSEHPGLTACRLLPIEPGRSMATALPGIPQGHTRARLTGSRTPSFQDPRSSVSFSFSRRGWHLFWRKTRHRASACSGWRASRRKTSTPLRFRWPTARCAEATAKCRIRAVHGADALRPGGACQQDRRSGAAASR